MNFREYAKENIVILDGGMGTMLESFGISPSESPESWCLTHPDKIIAVHKAYFDAGSSVVNTNTFGANLLKFSEDELERVISSAVSCARRAAELSESKKEKFVALDIGPLGRLLKPFGDLEFEKAYEIYAKTVKVGIKYGVDLITLETITDSLETKAALLAVRDNTDLPVIVTNAYGSDGKLLSGADAACMVALLEGMGADYIGANCSLGPKALLGVISGIVANASVPAVFKPNAGLPEIVNKKTVYSLSADDFADEVILAVEMGARLVGGCCGTTPEYISALAKKLEGVAPRAIEKKNATVITSFSKAHTFDGDLTVIGESINPTGKKRMKLAVTERDIDYIINLAVSEEENGADALDVNVGVAGTDEAEFLPTLIEALQYSTSLPLVIDTSNPVAMERALRVYNGKALINSVNGKQESMDAIFPLVKKYGGVVIALTLDETGIPSTAEERVAIAKRILSEAEKYGIDKKNIIFDPLALTVSTGKDNARVTLDTVRMINTELSAHTSLGVSNISFGLPNREALNSRFLAMAAANGLSAAIINPASSEMMATVVSAKALLGKDDNFKDYISWADGVNTDSTAPAGVIKTDSVTLEETILKGMRETAAELTDILLETKSPIEIINDHIVPALDEVGKKYESGKIYLPGLLLSAETSKCAFERIKTKVNKGSSNGVKIVIATVKGDIHDIGKNIVKLLLENYGFEVHDLGKDVPSSKIVEEAISKNCEIVALSALMTTTVSSMEEVIAELKKKAPSIKIIVGGAVLTEDYAKKIGADAYAKDAMGAVRYAEKFLEK